MARKPNYAFERKARAKAKAEKREAKRQAKLAAKASNSSDSTEPKPLDVAGEDDDSLDTSQSEKQGASGA